MSLNKTKIINSADVALTPNKENDMKFNIGDRMILSGSLGYLDNPYHSDKIFEIHTVRSANEKYFSTDKCDLSLFVSDKHNQADGSYTGYFKKIFLHLEKDSGEIEEILAGVKTKKLEEMKLAAKKRKKELRLAIKEIEKNDNIYLSWTNAPRLLDMMNTNLKKFKEI